MKPTAFSMDGMASLSVDAVRRWWYATPDYSWESLRQGLGTIFKEEIISSDIYQSLRFAVNKLESLGINFPKSPNELHQRIEFYL